MRVVTEGAVTGAGNGGVVAAGGVFHGFRSPTRTQVSRTPRMGRTAETGTSSPARLSPRGWTAVTDAVARIAPTECIAMSSERLRAHGAIGVRRAIARATRRAKALRASLLDRVARSDEVITDEVITDEDLVVMGGALRTLAPTATYRGESARAPWARRAAVLTLPPLPAAAFDEKNSRCDAGVNRVRGRGGRDAGQGDRGDARAVVATRVTYSRTKGRVLGSVRGGARGTVAVQVDAGPVPGQVGDWRGYQELVGRVGRGYVAGEIPVMFNTPNDATVVATSTADDDEHDDDSAMGFEPRAVRAPVGREGRAVACSRRMRGLRLSRASCRRFARWNVRLEHKNAHWNARRLVYPPSRGRRPR